MNKNQTIIPLEILILNDLLRRKAIDKELYDKAAQKILSAKKEEKTQTKAQPQSKKKKC